MSVPLPATEAERVEALRRYAILDTPPEAAFDRITRLAARAFGVPLAVLNLIDSDRQWTKACSSGERGGSIPRAISFCAHTILHNDVQVIPDTLLDARFADNPFTTTGLRFYAGAPLRSTDGYNLGTICIVDTVPRTLDAAQVADLMDLAALATDALELRRTTRCLADDVSRRQQIEQALRQSDEQLRLALRTAQMATWTWSIADDQLRWGAGVAQLFGLPDDAPLPATAQAFLDLVHPEDRLEMFTRIERAQRDGVAGAVEVRISWPDGSIHWLSSIGQLLVDHTGRPAQMTGAMIDITKRKRAEERLRKLYETTSTSQRDFDDTLDQLLRLGCQEFELETGMLTRQTPAGFQIVSVVTADSRLAPGLLLPDTSYCALTVREREPLVIQPALPPPSNGADGQSSPPAVYLGAPVIVANAIYGTLCFTSARRRQEPLTTADREFLQLIAQRIGGELERHQAEAELRASEARLTGIIASAMDAIITLDSQQRIVVFNSAAEQMFGCTAADVLGETIARFLPENVSAIHSLYIARFSATHTTSRSMLSPGRLTARHADGSIFPIEATISQIGTGEHKLYTVIIRDITARERADETLRLLESAVNQASDSVIITTADLDPPGPRIVFVNPCFTKITGYSAAEAIGASARLIQGPLTDPAELEQMREALRRGEHVASELISYRKDGQPFDMEWQIAPLRNADGIITHFISTQRDISARKRNEAALRASEAKLQLITAQMPTILWTCDHKLQLNSSMGAGLTRLGFAHEQFLGQTIHTLFASYQPAITAHLEALEGHSSSYELPLLDKVYDVRVEPLRDARETIIGCIGLAIDISERKSAEAALRDSEERFRNLVETTSDWVWEVDTTATYTYSSPNLRTILGYTSEEVLGKTPFHLMPPDEAERVAAIFGPIAAAQRPFANLVNINYHKDGHLVVLETNGAPFFDAQGQFRGYRGIDRDITARQEAEAALNMAYAQLTTLSEQLRRGRDLLRTLFDGLDDGMLLLGSDGEVLAANQALAALCGSTPEQLVGQHWPTFCTASDLQFPAQFVMHSLYDGRARRRRERYTPPQREPRILDFQTLPLVRTDQTVEQVILHVADVTERLEMEALAMQNARLAANGTLAATMAHEINTPLQSIRSCLYLAAKHADGQPSRYLELAREEIDRISAILRNLLDLHRPGSGTPVPVDLNLLIERALLLTGSTLAEHGIEATRDLAPDLPLLPGRPDQLTQVLLNLTLNAVDAMPEGGVLRFSTAVPRTGTTDAPPTLLLRIADTGSGMSPDTQARIFEPFFTTKAQGSGLGLAISQKIIAQHHGRISVQSVPGQGSCFTITFVLDNEF